MYFKTLLLAYLTGKALAIPAATVNRDLIACPGCVVGCLHSYDSCIASSNSTGSYW
jgi:hypothetical protein